eukprot:458497-Amphidinium_carterae.3
MSFESVQCGCTSRRLLAVRLKEQLTTEDCKAPAEGVLPFVAPLRSREAALVALHACIVPLFPPPLHTSHQTCSSLIQGLQSGVLIMSVSQDENDRISDCWLNCEGFGKGVLFGG